jgi:molybdate transport system regulatory protein
MAANRQPSSRGSARKPRTPVLRFRMRVTDGDKIAVGPGKIALLEAIASTGSITAAAKSLDMSYRRAWLLLDELNRSLEHPAVDSAKGGLQGGGSSLTDAGRLLITLYRRIEKRAETSCRDDIAQLMSLLAH